MSGDEELMEVQVGAEIPLSMIIPKVLLLALGLAVGLIPGIAAAAARAGGRFLDAGGYAAAVLDGHARYAPVPGPLPHGWNGEAVLMSMITVLAACAVAAAALYRGRLPALAHRLHPIARPARVLRQLHSGRVGDYAVWLLLGVGATAAILFTA
jgi:multicomponent Na+:H+ antiporter subunit D